MHLVSVDTENQCYIIRFRSSEIVSIRSFHIPLSASTIASALLTRRSASSFGRSLGSRRRPVAGVCRTLCVGVGVGAVFDTCRYHWSRFGIGHKHRRGDGDQTLPLTRRRVGDCTLRVRSTPGNRRRLQAHRRTPLPNRSCLSELFPWLHG